MELLINLGVGVLGILLYAVLTARDKNDSGVLNVMDYIRNQWSKWVISCIIIAIMAVIIAIVPEGAMAIKAVTGLDVSTTTSFITIGYILSSAGRKFIK